MKDIVLSNVIQMKCRAMHAFDGSLSYMPYGTGSQHINSVSRNFLNHLLLDEAEKLPNVTIFFNAKVTRVSKAGTLTVDFKKAGQTKRVPTRLVIGAAEPVADLLHLAVVAEIDRRLGEGARWTSSWVGRRCRSVSVNA